MEDSVVTASEEFFQGGVFGVELFFNECFQGGFGDLGKVRPFGWPISSRPSFGVFVVR